MALPKEPRQKMINIMYLVLMALLALEVSDQILDAFVVVNSGLKVTNLNYDKKNDASMGQFEFAMSLNPKETKPYYDAAKKINQWSADLCTFIDSVKHTLVSKTEGVSLKVADTLKLENVKTLGDFDAPTHYLINDAAAEDGSKGEAHQIKVKLNEFRKNAINLVAYFNPKDTALLNIGLLTGNQHSKIENRTVTWEVYNFYSSPLAAAVTLLTHVQNDVKNTQATVVQYLLSHIGSKDFKVSGFQPEIIPASNYVNLGDSFKAQIFLSAVSNSEKPKIYTGDFDSLGNKVGPDTSSVNVIGGTGYYTVKTDKIGPQKLYGIIKVKDPEGNVKSYPFHSEYLVAKPAVVISPTKMNVFYIGVDNPVEISAPGVPANAIHPSFQGPGSISGASGGNGQYVVRVSSGANTKCHIGVSATMPDGSHQNFPPQEFRIKAVPDPTCFVLGKKGNIRVPKIQLKIAEQVKATMENFDFDLPYTVTSFTMVVAVNGVEKQYPASGPDFTPAMHNIMNELQPGSTIIIEEVHCRSVAGARTIPGVTITIY